MDEGNDENVQENLAMAASLQNPLILDEILQNLDFANQKKCRLINSTWTRSVNFCLQKRKKYAACCVKIRWSTAQTRFHNASNPDLHLSQLTNLWLGKVGPVDCFPVSTFIISNLGPKSLNGDGRVLQKFFKLHGHKVKTLTLKGSQDRVYYCGNFQVTKAMEKTNRNILYRLFNRQLPNVEHLTLGHFSVLEFKWPEVGYEFCLPNLKSLDWDFATHMPNKIIKSAPNLEKIRTTIESTDDHEHLDVIIETGKLGTVRLFYCDYVAGSNFLTNLTLLGDLNQLTSLHFDGIDNTMMVAPAIQSQFLPSLNLLMENNKSSLKHLALSNLCGLYPGVKIPDLPKLKELMIGSTRTPPAPCFPRDGINLSKTFPNVHTLNSFPLDCLRDETIEKYFPSSSSSSSRQIFGHFPTVKVIEIHYGATENWMEKLTALCPNFKMLQLHDVDPRPELFANIYKKWSHLEALFLNLRDIPRRQMVCFDPVFTGLSVETCDRLRSGERTGQEEEEQVLFEELKVGPGLSDLKCLKRLKMSMMLYRPREDFDFAGPITQVTGRYAFSLLPNLSVMINVASSETIVEAVKKNLGPYADVKGPRKPWPS